MFHDSSPYVENQSFLEKAQSGLEQVLDGDVGVTAPDAVYRFFPTFMSESLHLSDLSEPINHYRSNRTLSSDVVSDEETDEDDDDFDLDLDLHLLSR